MEASRKYFKWTDEAKDVLSDGIKNELSVPEIRESLLSFGTMPTERSVMTQIINHGYSIKKGKFIPRDDNFVKRNRHGEPSSALDTESNIVQKKIVQMFDDDVYGAYSEIRVYPSDPVKTAKNIAKNFGSNFREPFIALLVELNRELARFGSSNDASVDKDEYKMFSYGLQKLSDGEVAEIKILLEQGNMTKTSIAEEFDCGIALIGIVNKLKIKGR